MYQTSPSGRHGRHAAVIGASISGLLTARVLSERFERVTLFDRDRLPHEPANRGGVPQGRHGHGLLASGYQGLTRLFPNLETDLLAAGAVPGDVIGSVRWFQHGHYKAKYRSGLSGILMSRALLEGTIRRQVLRLPNVVLQDGTRVLGLVSGGDVVKGLRVQSAGRDPESIEADLVVDASGRGSRTPAWLAELGYGAPPVEEVRIDLGYTTRTFRRRPGELGGDTGAILAPRPPRERRVGFMLAMEGERWIATIGGWLGEHAPADPEGYLAFARTLPRPDIYEVIRDAEPLTDPVRYSFPSNLRRRYDRLAAFPDGYLVVGDAICSFNPLYGQGMSVATLEALTLGECLDREPSAARVWRPFFRATKPLIDTPWTIAAGSDFAFTGVTGPRPAGTAFVNWYLNHVHRAASTDRRVCRAFFDVANLLRPPTTLFRPAVVARVGLAVARAAAAAAARGPWVPESLGPGSLGPHPSVPGPSVPGPTVPSPAVAGPSVADPSVPCPSVAVHQAGSRD